MEWLLLLAGALGITLARGNTGGVQSYSSPDYYYPQYSGPTDALQQQTPADVAQSTDWFQNLNLTSNQGWPANMDISQSGKDFIINNEGIKTKVYKDSAGYWTIGIGHKIVPGDPYYPYGPLKTIDTTTARNLFDADVEAIAAGYVRSVVTTSLTQNQFDALCDFCFNIGPTKFSTSTLLSKLNAGDYQGAADEFGRWVYAGGMKDPVLINRRNAERALFLGYA